MGRLHDQDWLKAEETFLLMAALKGAHITARFVGGCVRDAYLGRPVSDVDIAVDVPPEKVVQDLMAVGIRCVPTGIDHGTITAIVGEKSFQITSLRSDVSTDGRHAFVAYVGDWKTDAQRRDFTMNALYADEEGHIFDPLGTGLDDIKAKRVRFIGNPLERIQEDRLRILRFFRFSAHYAADSMMDTEGLAACRKLAPHLKELSAQRVFHECQRLCTAHNILPALTAMRESGVLAALFPFAPSFESGLSLLSHIHKMEVALDGQASPLLRLFALMPAEVQHLFPIHMKTSRKDRLYFQNLKKAIEGAGCVPSEFFLNKHLYLHGPYFVKDLILHCAGRALEMGKMEKIGKCEHTTRLRAVLGGIQGWQPPQFPLRGQDILQAGVPKGPEISGFLGAVKDWWIKESFRPNRAQCLSYLQKIRNNS